MVIDYVRIRQSRQSGVSMRSTSLLFYLASFTNHGKRPEWMNFFKRDSEVIMFSPCVFVGLFVSMLFTMFVRKI